MKKEIDAHEPVSYSDMPKFLRMLIDDQKQHSFSPPATLVSSSIHLGSSVVGTNFNPKHSEDYLLAFAVLTVGELARHSMSLVH